MKTILIIIGSASANSSNLKLAERLAELAGDAFKVKIWNELKTLPHFDPELSLGNTPQTVLDFRKEIEKADGVIISTPEYVFSIPAGLKNAIEWCVSTTVFSDKPMGLLTASSEGTKGHEELQLIMKTVMAKFTAETSLLIRSIKSKINVAGTIKDKNTEAELIKFMAAFKKLIR